MYYVVLEENGKTSVDQQIVYTTRTTWARHILHIHRAFSLAAKQDQIWATPIKLSVDLLDTGESITGIERNAKQYLRGDDKTHTNISQIKITYMTLAKS